MTPKHIAAIIVVTLVLAGITAGGIALQDTPETPGPGGGFPHPPATADGQGDRPGVVDAADVNTTVRTEVGNGGNASGS